MDKPNKSKIASFKKFSELNKSGKISEEKDSVSKMQLGEDKLPMNPNLPIESTKNQLEQILSILNLNMVKKLI